MARSKRYVVHSKKEKGVDIVYRNHKFKFLEKIVTLTAVAMPFTIIPQMTEIWMNKDATGVSFITWILFLVLTIPLVIYSIIKRERKLALMWILCSVFYVVIISGIIVYG